ncbi:MAG: Large cysteine-rich periplasmic protein OmcB, partial [Actinomycetota bacterium]
MTKRPALAALLALTLAASLGSSLPASAATDVAPLSTFPERYSVNAAGDLVITGNTLMTCPETASTCAEALRGGGTSARFNNNSYSMVMVDIDTDPTTVNSSSADLQIPAGAPVLFAGLYWGAGASGDQAKGSVPANAGSIRMRVPGADDYTAITGSVTTISTSGSNKTYSGFADVTAQVRAAGRGTYVVADVKGALGVNHFAGWSLVVVYGDPSEPVRAMSVFDGLVSVTQGSPATIDVAGFRTPPTGPVRTALGVVAYEGDLGITGDQFLLNGSALSDGRRPAGNYFNSSITTRTGRLADYPNQLGFDTGLVDATGRIANNATSATFRASSTGDQYYPIALTFSTELFSPRFAARKSVVDLNGDVVRAGDELDYTLVLTNDVTVDNGDASTGTVITDVLPAGAAYVPGTLKVDGQSVADSGSVATFADGSLTLRVGEGASADAGGRLAIGQSVIVTYRMRVDSDAAPGTILANDFRVAGAAATSGFAVTGISNETSLTVVADDADLSIAKSVSPTTLTAGQTATYTLRVDNAGPGSAESLTVTDSIPAGLTLVSARGQDWSCVETAPTVRCTLPSLPAGASAPPIAVTVTVDEEASDSGSVTNTATVSSDTPDPDPSGNTSTVTVPIDRSADLAISKWHDGQAITGDTITYSIGVRNGGPSDATGVTVRDVLPDYLRLVSASGEGWTCTTAVECTLAGTLVAGSSAESITLVAEVLATAPSEVRNTATVSGNEPDPTPANDTATDTADTARIFDAIESLSHPGKAIAGGPAIPVTVRAFNAGPGAVPAGADAIQTITLPPGTSLTGHSGAGWACIPSTGSATRNPLTVRCTLPLTQGWAVDTSLTPLVLQVSVTAGETQDKELVAEVTTNSTMRDVDLTNNRATDIITLETDADLAITTTSSAALEAGGASRPLTFTVRNNGPVSDPGPITVRFSRLSNLSLAVPSGSPWVCDTADGRTVCTLAGNPLAPSQAAPPLTLNVSAPDPETLPGSYDLTGIVSSPQPDSNPANDAATAPITIAKEAGIWTSKTASPTRVTAGDTVSFTLTVSNAAPYGGPSAARDVYLTDDFGALGLTIESITPDNSGLDCSASTLSVVSCYIPVLDFGAEASVIVVARTDPAWTTPGRTFTNVVTATSSTPGGDRPPGQVTVT